MPRKMCQVRIVVRPAQKYASWKVCPRSVVQTVLYDPTARKTLKITSKTMPMPALIFMPSSPCCTECTDPYNTASNNRKITQHSNRNVPLGFVPNISWEMCSLCYPNFPLSSLLENLSQSPSLVSCTLPNAFFYKIWRWPFPSQVSFHLSQP